MQKKLHVVRAGADRDAYLPLLLLADESVAQVRGYYQRGDLYALDSATGEPIAVVLVIPEAEGAVELKAVAVSEPLQRQGIGRWMIAEVLDLLRRKHVPRVLVGTGNASLGELAFYQKAGFRLLRIERDFFNQEKGYPAGFRENGILLRDMVWMDLTL